MHEMTDWYTCKEPGCSVIQLYASMISTHYKEKHGILKGVREVVAECRVTDEAQIAMLTKEKVKDEQKFDGNELITFHSNIIENHQGIVKHKKGSIFSQVDEQTDNSILKLIDQEDGEKVIYQCPHCDITSNSRKKTLLHATAVHKMKWFKVCFQNYDISLGQKPLWF